MRASRFLLLAAAALLTALPLAARGPLSEEARDTIHGLAHAHAKIDRGVRETDDGYVATTTSEDKETAAMLRKHIRQMEERLKTHGMVRRWDPAFPEFIAHYPDMETKIEEIEGGIRVTVKGKTPEAVKVARNHAKVVSDFVKRGPEGVQAEHAKALDE